MPVIKSAKKKLRKDKKLTVRNKVVKNLFKKTIKETEKNPTQESVRKAVKIIDKTAKKNIIHPNKASRLKSRLTKLLVKGVKSADKITKKNPIKKSAPAKKIRKKK